MANIGILKETHNNESRVALTHYAVSSLKKNGHKVFITSNAGLNSGIENKKYEMAGATILLDNKAVIDQSEILLKIQKPTKEEIMFFKPKQILFCFLNLMYDSETAINLANAKVTAIGYETIFDDGRYPILEPVSKLVGKACYMIGASLLSMPVKGKGVFLGGSAGASRSKVVIFGGGNAGKELMKMANSAGSRVTVFDKSLSVINSINDYNPQIQTMYPYHDLVIKEIANADLILGATFSGKNSVNKILTVEMIKMMEPKSVIIDLTTEFGGISATTTFDKDRKTHIYQKHNIIHYCVPNIASTIPKTSSSALSAPILHYLIRFLITEYQNIEDDIISNAIQIKDGNIANFIKIDIENEKNEYQQKIKYLVNQNEDYDLESMFEYDNNNNKYNRDIFETDETVEKNPINEDVERKSYSKKNVDLKNWDKDDIFSNANFDDIEID